jgi:hypothetical protein
MEAVPPGQIDLPVTFSDEGNFRKETLTFEVVSSSGTYHTILGRPAYAKFMAVPHYTYLKLKMPRPKRVITVDTKFQHAYECDTECFQLTEALIRSEKMVARTSVVNPDNDVTMVESTYVISTLKRNESFYVPIRKDNLVSPLQPQGVFLPPKNPL